MSFLAYKYASSLLNSIFIVTQETCFGQLSRGNAKQCPRYKNTQYYCLFWNYFPLHSHTLVHLFLKCKRTELLIGISHSKDTVDRKCWIKATLC